MHRNGRGRGRSLLLLVKPPLDGGIVAYFSSLVRTRARWSRALVALAALSAAPACGGYGTALDGGSLGVTPGGAKDIGLARDTIERGGIPSPEDFTIEGLYAEHDLSVANRAPCHRPVCIDASAAAARALDDGERDLFVQLAMSSNLSLEDFERGPLNLGVVIDASGSMESVLPNLKAALHALVDELRADDRLAIVVYESSAETIVASTLASDRAALHAAVDTLETGGSTNMEEGMRLGYQEIGSFVGDDRLSRLMVFTDAMPNTGATDVGSFRAMTRAAAARGIGFTFFGFGADFSADFVDEIAHLRGGNYRFVGPNDVEPIFEEELDFLVTPVAYDLKLRVSAPALAPLETVYGIPRASENVNGTVAEISTLFLSRRKGAIVARLDGAKLGELSGPEGITLGEIHLSYETPDGEVVAQVVEPALPATSVQPETELIPTDEMRRTLAVTNQFFAMQHVAAHRSSADPTVVDRAIAGLEAAHAALPDPNLMREIGMMKRLRENAGF